MANHRDLMTLNERLHHGTTVRLKGGDPKETSFVKYAQDRDGKILYVLEKTLAGENMHPPEKLEVVFDITDDKMVGKHIAAELNKLAGKKRFTLAENRANDACIFDSDSPVRVDLTRPRGHGYMSPGSYHERPITGLQIHRQRDYSRSMPGIFSIDRTGKFGAAKLLARIDQVAASLVAEKAEAKANDERHRQAESRREAAMKILDGIFKEHQLKFEVTGSNARAVTLANGATVEFMHEHGEVRVHRIDGIDLGTPANVRILLAAVAQM